MLLKREVQVLHLHVSRLYCMQPGKRMYNCVISPSYSLLNNNLLSRPPPSPLPLSLSVFIDSFSIGPDDHTVDPGVSLLLFCTHRGSQPPATITWTHNNNVVTISSHLMVESHLLLHTNPTQVSSRLTIVSVEAGDAGSYRCQATNELLPGTLALSDEGILNIRGECVHPCVYVCVLSLSLSLNVY